MEVLKFTLLTIPPFEARPLLLPEGWDASSRANQRFKTLKDLKGRVSPILLKIPRPTEIKDWLLPGVVTLRWIGQFISQNWPNTLRLFIATKPFGERRIQLKKFLHWLRPERS